MSQTTPTVDQAQNSIAMPERHAQGPSAREPQRAPERLAAVEGRATRAPSVKAPASAELGLMRPRRPLTDRVAGAAVADRPVGHSTVGEQRVDGTRLDLMLERLG